MSNYWKIRTLRNEQRAAEIGEAILSYYEDMMLRSYRAIQLEIAAIVAKERTTATDFWIKQRLEQLEVFVEAELSKLAADLDAKTATGLTHIYNKTYENWAKDFGVEFIEPNKFQVEAIIRENFHGNNYSERIWKNTEQLANRIHNDMERMIIRGHSPDEITKQLMRDFDVGYNNASRLIRTESSRIYNEATEASYKEYGIDREEFLAEDDACDHCKEHDGKTYKVGKGPQLPLHPRCRCVYLPVVE